MATETIYLRVDPKLDKRLRRIAVKEDQTLTALIVGVLEEWVSGHDNPGQR